MKIHLTEVCISDFLLYFYWRGYVTVVDVATGDYPVVQLVGENVMKLGGQGHLVGEVWRGKGYADMYAM